MHNKIIALLLAACMLIIAGCSGKDDGMLAGKLGEPVETAFLTFTVAGAAWGDPADTQAPAPPEGKKYLWVEVQVQNGSGSDQPVYYDEFDLYIDGNPRFPERSFSERQLAENQMLGAGNSVSGYLVYLVPENAKELKLVYEEYYEGDIPGERFKVVLEKKSIQTA